MSRMSTAEGPRIPREPIPRTPAKPPDAPKTEDRGMVDFKHSWEIPLFFLGHGVKHLPRLARTLLLPLIAVTALNIVLASINNYTLSGVPKTLLMTLVFLTASYNSIIPRTLFWVIVFTLGRKVFLRVRRDGLEQIRQELMDFRPIAKEAVDKARSSSSHLLIGAAGVGFAAANFLTRNNRFDKMLVTYVLAFAVLDTMTKGTQGMLYKSVRLVVADAGSLIKKTIVLDDASVTVLLSGFVTGLLGDTLFALVKWGSGGYVTGLVLVAAGIGLFMKGRNGGDGDRHQDMQG